MQVDVKQTELVALNTIKMCHLHVAVIVLIVANTMTVTARRTFLPATSPAPDTLGRQQHEEDRHVLTAAERSELLSQHNTLRAREGAADMQLMVWDNVLEAMARNWAALCLFYDRYLPNIDR